MSRTAPDALRLPLPSRKVERIDGLQALRMIAVLLVAWMHVGQFFSGIALPNLGMFGVDIFFVISGFILSLIALRDSRRPGIWPSLDFLRRRVVRIYPVYWLFALFPLLHYFHIHRGLLYLPSFFLLPGLHYPELPTLVNFSWTLILEVSFYLLFGAVLLFAARRTAVSAMICILVVVVAIGGIVGIRRPVLIVAMNPMLLEFAMGGVAAWIYSRMERSPILGWLLALLGIGIACYLQTIPQERTYEWNILTDHGAMTRSLTWGLSAALIVFGTVLASPTMSSPVGKLSVVLGNASYSTYLLSGFLLLRFDMLFHLSQSHGWAKLALLQASVTVGVMMLGMVFYLYVEKRLLSAANRIVPHLPPQHAMESQRRAAPIR